MAITSDSDHATNQQFRIGRRIGTVAQSFKDDAEHRLAINTIGHLPELRTHRLWVETKEAGTKPAPKAKSECACDQWHVNKDVKPKLPPSCEAGKFSFGNNMFLEATDPNPGLGRHWLVQTPKRVIDGHNDFYTDHVRDFLFQMFNKVAMQDTTECATR